MKRNHLLNIGAGVSIVVGLCLMMAQSSAQNLSQHCQWGSGTTGAVTPTGDPTSSNVIMTPTVMNLGGSPLPEIAFISFRTPNDSLFDRGGTLRIINGNCVQLASFPNYVPCPSWSLPANCPANLFTTPRLAPGSGLALGNVDWSPDVEIIAVLDSPHPMKDHKQIIAFNLVGNCLKPKWCSSPLQSNDVIHAASYPALAQLDQPGSFSGWGDLAEIIIDNKVYTGFGGLRYSGFSTGGNNCSTVSGGLPCPHSRTTVVAGLLGGTALPQLITGRGLYQSNPMGGPAWTGSWVWAIQMTTPVTMTKSSSLFPAVADLDSNATPEIVVSDWNLSRLNVLSPAGAVLAWVQLPVVTPGTTCGAGPPMIGNVDGQAGPEIGVASCTRYTVYKFAMGGVGTPAGSPGTLTQVWSQPTNDPSGGTTSTLGYTPDPVIYYADEQKLYVFNGASPTGAPLQTFPNTSGTQIEGPIIAALDSTMQGRVIVVANAYWLPLGSGYRGVRIFHNPPLPGTVRNYWNQQTYHMTNVTSSSGVIPITEQSSWLPGSAARNSYRVQQP